MRKKELEAQKARIVAQTVPVREEQEKPEDDEEMVKLREKHRDRYEVMGDRENSRQRQPLRSGNIERRKKRY